MIGGEKLNEEKGEGGEKKEKAEIIEAWKWTFHADVRGRVIATDSSNDENHLSRPAGDASR